MQSVDDGILEGRIKNRNDIIAEGDGNLSASAIKSMEESLIADPAYSGKSISEIKTLINNYDPRADDAENMTQYHSIMQRIRSEVPKSMQGNLNADLYAISQKAVEKGQFPDPKQKFAGEIETRIERYAKIGLFDPEGYSTKKAQEDEKYRLDHRDQETAVWNKVEATKNLMREYLVKSGESDPVKASEYLDQLLGPEMRKTKSKEWEAQKKETTNVERSLRGGGPNSWIEPFNPKPTIVPTEDLRKKLDANERSFGTYGPTSSTGDANTVGMITSYRPGGTRAMGLSPTVEGGPLDAHGNRILGNTTMEDYHAGRGPGYVTVAMDKTSSWQGKYLASPAYPNVVFKVMDNGGYGNNKTKENWIDIAWTDPEMAKRFTKRNVPFKVIDKTTASRIASNRGTT